MNSPMMTMNTTALIDFNSFIKKMLALCLGVVMTMMLFYMMYLLIKNDAVPESQDPTAPIPSVVMPIIDDIVTEVEAKIERPVEQKRPPIPYEPIVPTATTPTIPEFRPITFKPPKEINPMAINAQPMPMVRVAPVYPQSAVVRRIEGFVDVVFDVTETGGVENIQIVYAEPEKIFNSAVIKSVSRWKYRPKMEDGVAMKMSGLRERIRFNMDK
jgi:periplasmic protein TonB